MLLKWILKSVEGLGLDLSGSGQGEVAGCCEHGDEPSGYVNCGEFIDQLRNCQLLSWDCAPWPLLLSYGGCIYVLRQKSNTQTKQKLTFYICFHFVPPRTFLYFDQKGCMIVYRDTDTPALSQSSPSTSLPTSNTVVTASEVTGAIALMCVDCVLTTVCLLCVSKAAFWIKYLFYIKLFDLGKMHSFCHLIYSEGTCQNGRVPTGIAEEHCP